MVRGRKEEVELTREEGTHDIGSERIPGRAVGRREAG